MTFLLTGQSMAKDIAKGFSSAFPFLRIELYKLNTLKKESLPLCFKINQDSETVRTINMKANTTVAALEKEFFSVGVKAEVLRKSGKVWIETSLTSDWTLQQQNLEGEEISKHYSCINKEGCATCLHSK